MCTAVVAVELLHFAALEVRDCRCDERFVKLAITQLCNLGEEQVAHILEGLTLLGSTTQNKASEISVKHSSRKGIEHLLLLYEVGVDKTTLAVVEDVAYDLLDVCILARHAATCAPTHIEELGVVAVYLLNLRRGDRLCLGEREFRQLGVGLQ